MISTRAMLFWMSLLPFFLTTKLAKNFSSALPQFIYASTFVLIEAFYLLTTKFQLDIKDNQ